MKQLTVFAFLLVFFFTSCHKDDFNYTYPELDELLISVTRTDEYSEFRTEFKYDSIDRLVEVKNILAEGQIITESYSYNEQGELVEKRNGNYTTTFTYNSAGQLTSQNFQYTTTEGDNEWQEKTEFQYRSGKMSKGIVYSKDDEILQYISYKYDSRGNTLEKNVHSHSSDSELIIEETKYRYDSKANPNAYSGVNMLNGYTYTYYADIKQINNAVYSSYFNLVSSSMLFDFKCIWTHFDLNLRDTFQV